MRSDWYGQLEIPIDRASALSHPSCSTAPSIGSTRYPKIWRKLLRHRFAPLPPSIWSAPTVPSSTEFRSPRQRSREARRKLVNTFKVIATVLLLASGVFAEKAALPKDLPAYGPEKPCQTPSVKASKLDNGLTVWLVSRRDSPSWRSPSPFMEDSRPIPPIVPESPNCSPTPSTGNKDAHRKADCRRDPGDGRRSHRGVGKRCHDPFDRGAVIQGRRRHRSTRGSGAECYFPGKRGRVGETQSGGLAAAAGADPSFLAGVRWQGIVR